ncbi:MAG: tRNA uridine-5-carboxymethylaminomethyl(34) synthesis GTPase MnmE [Oscillospiraceae bacterium]
MKQGKNVAGPMLEPIAAIATGPNRCAIGIIRLSGRGVIETVSRLFTPKSGKPFDQSPDRKLVFGILHDGGGVPIDQALCTLTRGPNSYTGEDTAELQCHGSPMLLRLVLEALFQNGVRQAGPGEFTKRAFLNGRMDLTQAEAVVDLVDAETPAAARCAAGQLGGALSRRFDKIYGGLVDISAHFCAVLDYPDEDLNPCDRDTIGQALREAEEGLGALLQSYDRGKYLTRGVPCCIVGHPNVGKSSLLNALLGYERAIVTDVAGTTRDTIEERCILGGVLLRLIDTAGLRDTGDAVERMGVARSRKAVAEADLVLAVLDGSQPATGEDKEVLQLAATAPHCIVIRNKSDLPRKQDEELLGSMSSVTVSALTGDGLEDLAAAVAAIYPHGGAEDTGALLTNSRQFSAAQRAKKAVETAAESLKVGVSPDAVLMDVELALSALGELTGKTVREDVTARIFERFCVGK